MAMNVADRVLTIAVTVTITSAFWIAAGGSLLDMARERSRIGESGAPEAAAGAGADRTAAPDSAGPDPLHSGAAAVSGGLPQGALMVPVLGVRAEDLTDTFTQAREDGERLHEAIDIMAPAGTAVVAAAPGTVEKLFRSDAGGKTIYVRSNDRQSIAYYAHLNDYAAGLKEGQKVRRGQRLGTVGSTGNASEQAPHLHFAILRTAADAEWWEPATAVNPYPLLTRNNR